MTLIWLVTGAALAVAIAALALARRNAKHLRQLSERYWELKYKNGELRAQLQQITGESTPQQTTTPAATQGRDSFVPISSLKR